MLDSAASSTALSQEQEQMSRQIETGNFAEEYFASLSGPAKRLIQDVVAVREAYEEVWTGLDDTEQDQIINENIIRPEAILTYEVKKPTNNQVRLSSFGVDKVFPRLKIETGQKENSFEDTLGSQDLGSDCTYSYRDEHSAPWSWLTRSQQDLRFESGHSESLTSDELAEQGLDTVSASPSRVLQRQSLLIRQSKGNPLYAKPVGIPIVPQLPKQEIAKMDTKPPVSPHKINNFVYEEDNRIILDFGAKPDLNNSIENDVGSESSRSSSSLLAKMKETKATLKKSLSNVSNGGTLKRSKKAKSNQASPCSTLSRSSTLKSNTIVKPSTAPPPPPPRTSTVMSQSLYLPAKETSSPPAEDIVKPLEEFKIDLNTQSGQDIPKTGFDFLDNW